MTDTSVAGGEIRYGTPAGRWVLAAAVLGSGIAFLDSTVVNVALPAIERDLDAGISGLQWTLDGYLLTLTALLLVGGSLGDLYGRRRMFVIGLIGFSLASALCALAPTTAALVAGRALQGIAAAMLVPGSLAIISTNFAPEHRGKAIGAWSGLAGVTTAIGPPLGGWLVEAASWRWIFLINLPISAVAVWVATRHIPETRSDQASRPDIPGGVLAVLGLGGLMFALIEGPGRGWTDPVIVGAVVLGVLFIVGFLLVESRAAEPMLPLSIFKSRQFAGVNATTLVVYFGLSGALFFLVLELQVALGYSAFHAGFALLPITILLLVLSPAAGQLGQTLGPRLPMTFGPFVAGIGLAMLAPVSPGSSYWTGVFPGVAVFGLGLSATVAPLTAAMLSAIDRSRAGIGSGVNNAISRLAGLLAVALLPLAAGVAGISGVEADVLTPGFRRAMLISAGVAFAGGIISWVTIRNDAEPPEPPGPPGSVVATTETP